VLKLPRYFGAPCFPVTISRGSHGLPQIPTDGRSAITQRAARPAVVDLNVDTSVTTEIGINPEMTYFRAFRALLAETEGFDY
jgi:hypothetical protein